MITYYVEHLFSPLSLWFYNSTSANTKWTPGRILVCFRWVYVCFFWLHCFIYMMQMHSMKTALLFPLFCFLFSALNPKNYLFLSLNFKKKYVDGVSNSTHEFCSVIIANHLLKGDTLLDQHIFFHNEPQIKSEQFL